MLNLPAKKYYLYNKCATVIRTFQEDLKDSENLHTNTLRFSDRCDLVNTSAANHFWDISLTLKSLHFYADFFSSNTIDQTKSHISGHDQNSETLHTKTLSNP